MIEVRLVFLDCKQVEAASLDDEICNFGLAAHRIDCNRCISNVEFSQELWNSHNFVGLLFCLSLPNYNAHLPTPSAHGMDRRDAFYRVIAASARLSIDVNVSLGIFQFDVNHLSPAVDHVVKCFWI